MNLTNSDEEYLKTIYILKNNNEKIRVTDIAQKLKITKPSVNTAINKLKKNNLVNYEVYGNILLTNEGDKIAKDILRKQDILRVFLVDVLEVEAEKAEKETISMKHAISEETVKKLEKYIAKVFNLGNLNCNYDVTSSKCRNCIKTKK